MNISTRLLEFATLCLGLLMLAAFGSAEAAAHPRLVMVGVTTAVIGLTIIVTSGLKQSRR